MTCPRMFTKLCREVTGLLCLLVLCPTLLAAEPVVSGIVPYAAAPGVTTDIALSGADLMPPLQVWTSFGGTAEILPGATPGTTAILKLTVPAESGAFVGSVIVGSATGPSNPFQVVIDDLPTIPEVSTNHALQTPQVLTWPGAVDAVSEAAVADYFQIEAAAGAPLSIDVIGSRLGSDFDPLLRLLTVTGEEIARSDDDAVLGADCRLRHVFPQAGNYIIEVRDSRHRAGGRYRLRMGDFPLVTTTYPPALVEGSIAQVSVVGVGTTGFAPAIFQLPRAIEYLKQPLPPKFLAAAGKGSGLVSLTKTKQDDVIMAEEVATAPAGPVTLRLPQSWTGKLEFAGDIDTAMIPARVGDRLRVSDLLGEGSSAARLAIRLYQPSGPLAAEWLPDVEGELLQFVATEAGLYRVTVEDMLARGGEDYVYRLQLASGNGFALHAKPDKALKVATAMAQGQGVMAIDVQISRFGYAGPVKLSLVGDVAGFQLFNNIIPENAAEVKMLVIPPAGATPGQLTAFRVRGEANVAGEIQQVDVSTQKLARLLQPAVAYPPQSLEGIYRTGTVAAGPAWFKTQINSPPIFAPELALGSVKIGVDRVDPGFKDSPIKLSVADLPPGVTAEEKRPAVGPHEDFELVLKGPKELAPGTYPFRLLVYSDHGGGSQGVVVAETQLLVGDPLTLQVPAIAPVAVGGKLPLVINVARLGKEAAPVQIAIANYPPGITGPAEATIPADQATVTVELAVAADAPLSKTETLQLTATSMSLGQPITRKSALIGLEVRNANP